MKKVIYLILFSIFLTACSGEHPSNDDFNNSLNQGIQTTYDQIILNATQSAENSAVYMLQNTSDQSIYVNHPADHPGTASAGWASRLDPNQWSALALDRENFAITCHAILNQGKIQDVPCANVLNVKRIKASTNTSGSYWIAENMPYKKVLQVMGSRGFKIEI